MKTGNELAQIVYGYWAKRFGCEREDFLFPGTLVIREEQLAETGKMHLYHIDKMSVVRADPALAKQAGLPEGYDRGFGSLTVSTLPDAIQAVVESTFLDYYLDPQDFKCVPVRSEFTVRQLDATNDQALLLDLYAACTEEDLDLAAISLEEPDDVISGIFDGTRLVAYAGYRAWEDTIVDIGVLIHPEYRGRGLGKSVVSSLCECCFRNDVIPMYRVFSYNIHSCKLAEAIGFRPWLVIETLKMTQGNDTV
jgi:RimJ/RimL family protein N-acetyltransferase